MQRAAEIQQNARKVLSKISNCRLVAVSKLKPASDIQHLYDIGMRNFGESYVKELVEKSSTLPSDIRWHFIGALQSNKIKALASIPNLFAIETLDSVKKASILNNSLQGRADKLNVFIQVNTSQEDTKNGVGPEEVLEIARHVCSNCNNLSLMGLMTIGSKAQSLANGLNPDFEVLKKCRDTIMAELNLNFLELSMGMSSDFEQAIAQGSTNVRVGSTIFGERN